MSQTGVALIAALIGACSALAGQALGPVFTSRRAHAQWLRDKRAALWEQAITVLEECYDVLLDRYSARDDAVALKPRDLKQDRLAADARAESLMIPARNAGSRLAFYVSEDTAEKLRKAVWTYVRYMDVPYIAEEYEQDGVIGPNEAMIRYRARLDDLEQAMKRELKV
jgi:hypothetical protein